MACDDLLSALGDDLLRHILSFAHAKEAASTGVLSRRWRNLWRSSGAVNLAVAAGAAYDMYEDDEAFYSRRDAFVRAAESALAGAASGGITRLTLHMEFYHADEIGKFLHRGRDSNVSHDVVGGVVTHPAASRVEELRIDIVDPSDIPYVDTEMSHNREGYSLQSLASWAVLRVLDLSKCLGLPPQAVFPRLATLRLRRCIMDPKSLQAMIDFAPGLTTVHLDHVFFTVPHQYHMQQQQQERAVLRLRCLAATALDLVLCTLETREHYRNGGWSIEIDAPRLRSFTYKGLARPFHLVSPAPDMAHTDLRLLQAYDPCQETIRLQFWYFVRSFTNTKVLKLRVSYLEDIAVADKSRRAELLCQFPNVRRLHLEGVHYDPPSKATAVAIANLLRCCPVLTDLRLKLSAVLSDASKYSRDGTTFLENKRRSDYDRSVHDFMHRKSRPATSLDGTCGGKVSDIPGLRGRSFACMQCLRRVSLQFRVGPSSRFGFRLVKFFASNGMVLEQICIDSGNRTLSQHISLDPETWKSTEDNSRSRKSLDSTTDATASTTGLVVLPLRR